MSLLFALLLSLQLCVDVHDGDTIRLQDGRRVRLWGIDAPELAQPYGPEAQRHLSSLCLNSKVRLETHGEDRYGRTLAVVWVGRLNCNESLLQMGLAWWYEKYTPHETRYREIEMEARRLRWGLWGVARIPPWEFRHPER